MKPNEDPVTVKPKDNPVSEDPQKLQDPQWLLRRKKTLFGFLLMVYEWGGGGEKFSKENLGLGMSRGQATSHLKIEAEVLFS